jgi:hypothetical protein
VARRQLAITIVSNVRDALAGHRALGDSLSGIQKKSREVDRGLRGVVSTLSAMGRGASDLGGRLEDTVGRAVRLATALGRLSRSSAGFGGPMVAAGALAAGALATVAAALVKAAGAAAA